MSMVLSAPTCRCHQTASMGRKQHEEKSVVAGSGTIQTMETLHVALSVVDVSGLPCFLGVLGLASAVDFVLLLPTAFFVVRPCC